MNLSAPAKINLFLHIVGRRPDGYHELQTAFQFIDFGDQIQIDRRKDGKICLHSQLDIPQENNLVWQAARLLQQVTGTVMGADIYLSKQIPMGGGLGGGSSNAAATLVGLNQIWKTKLLAPQLEQLGAKLGADVPIFVRGQTSWAEGIGEILTPMAWPEPWYVVIIPPCSVNTAEVFSHSQLTRDTPRITIADFLSNPNLGQNDFTPLVCQLYPPIAAALDWLAKYGVARLTGSGSAIYATFARQSEAERVLQQLPSSCRGFVAKGMNRSPLYPNSGVSPSGKAPGFDLGIPRFES